MSPCHAACEARKAYTDLEESIVRRTTILFGGTPESQTPLIHSMGGHTFTSKFALAAYLERLGPLYAEYTASLWDAGVRTSAELAHASLDTLRKCGIKSDLHLDNIKATAAKGEELQSPHHQGQGPPYPGWCMPERRHFALPVRRS